MRDHSIAALELLAEPVDGQVDGLFLVLAANLPSHQLNTGTFQVRTKVGSFVNLLSSPGGPRRHAPWPRCSRALQGSAWST